MRILMFLLAWALAPSAWAAHGYAMWGDLKYPASFKNFDYANPEAPKGGELRMVSNLRYSTFDKYNPFTIKGSPPAYLSTLLFDSLLSGSMDETASGYGLLAEDVEVAADRLSATFRLRPEARFQNGKPVLAADVKYSYETLISPYAAPAYKTMLEEVAGIDVLDERKLRFRFKKPNRELPLTVGGLPVFSRDWGMVNGKAKRFDEIVTDTPIGSGPYKIGPVRWGRDITYVRDPNYWGRDLPIKRGAHNFERITVKIYRDNTARLEALKAGEFDLMTFYSAGDWARRVNGRKFDSGELVKHAFEHKQPAGFQSYVLNTRRPLLKDKRVREALGLAMDFEYMYTQMFYRGYPRVKDIFGNTECQATGTPSPAEIELLEPLRGKIPDEVFGPMYEPPVTDGPGRSLRDNLRRAQALLKEAGWEYRDGALRNAAGERMVLEYLDSRESGVRTLTPWIRNLEKLGIELRFSPVDFALYQQRLDKFEFDIMTINFQGTHNPGQQMLEIFGSKAADVEGGGNFFGVKNPAVDALLAKLTAASTKEQLLPACKALDRVIMYNHYLIPQWSLTSHRMVYNAWRLAFQAPMPGYNGAEEWVMYYWWSRGDAQAR